MAELFQAYQSGQLIGQRQREQRVSEQQFDRKFDRDSALQQLQEDAQKLMNVERGLDIMIKRSQKERELELKAGQLDAIRIRQRMSQQGPTPELAAEFFDLLTKQPSLLADKVIVQPMLQGIEASDQIKRIGRERKAAEDALVAGGMVRTRTTIDDTTGLPTSVFEPPTDPKAAATTEFERLIADLPPEEQERRRTARLDAMTAPPASSVLDPAEILRINLATENLLQRMRGGQLDERKFKLEIINELRKIETDPLLKPADKAAQKAEYLRSLRAMGVTTDFVEPQGLRDALTPAPSASPATRRLIFKNGQLVPAEP